MTDGLALATRGLQKRYGQRMALAGLDLSVPSGVVYGFLGPNGAGKTTTMRLLTGLIHPTPARSRSWVARSVGAIGAACSRWARSSSRRRSTRTSRRARTCARWRPRAPRPRARRIEELLELVGLRDRARDKVQTYSLGMKQRLGIAAALLSDPSLLLLDEPANGLDPAGIVAMRETLRHLASTGKTVFVSSHILGEVQQLADVLGIIAAGRLVREGPIEQLLEGEGLIKVRVAPAEVAAARRVLDGLVPGTASEGDGSEGWLSLRIDPSRAAEVNRALATADIYASGLETGSDLESLFLELTAGEASTSHEGTFFGVAGGNVPPPGSGGAATSGGGGAA